MIRSHAGCFVIREKPDSPLSNKTEVSSCQQHPHAGAQQDDGMHGARQR